MTQEEAQGMAGVILSMLDTIAQSAVGPEAVMNPWEKALIEPSLKRTLEKHTKVADRVSRMADPLALVMGMGMWASRVYEIKRKQVAGNRRTRTERQPGEVTQTEPTTDYQANRPENEPASNGESEAVESLLRNMERP